MTNGLVLSCPQEHRLMKSDSIKFILFSFWFYGNKTVSKIILLYNKITPLSDDKVCEQKILPPDLPRIN